MKDTGEESDRALEVIGMATINRRTALATGAAGAAAAGVTALLGVPASMAAATPAAKTAKPLLARSRWAAQLGATFTLTSPVAAWQVRLERVGDLFPVLEVDDEDRFSLTFASGQAGPPQGTFRMSRPGFEATPLFLVPNADRGRHLAVVNRI